MINDMDSQNEIMGSQRKSWIRILHVITAPYLFFYFLVFAFLLSKFLVFCFYCRWFMHVWCSLDLLGFWPCNLCNASNGGFKLSWIRRFLRNVLKYWLHSITDVTSRCIHKSCKSLMLLIMKQWWYCSHKQLCYYQKSAGLRFWVMIWLLLIISMLLQWCFKNMPKYTSSICK